MASNESSSRKAKYAAIAVVLIVAICAVIALALGLGLGLGLRTGDQPQTDSLTFRRAAVATDAAPCSQIGADILGRGGSAVDAAISASLCVGVVNLHSTGIGGGGFMIVYKASTGEAVALDFREKAPMNASTFMYNNTAPDASRYGGLAIAVPGQLHGLYEAWRRYGTLPWKQLFDPVVDLARKGFTITPAINRAIESNRERILSGNFSGLANLLAPGGQLLRQGDTLRQTDLADTLERISEQGIGYFYNSTFTESMVEELQNDWDSIITVEDFWNYRTAVREVVRSRYKGLEMLGMPPPSAGGAVLGLILNILDNYSFTADSFSTLSYHQIVEAFKFAFAQRLKLGDTDFNSTITDVVNFMLRDDTAMDMLLNITDDTTHEPDYYTRETIVRTPVENQGTSHLSVLAENGDAVAVTTTINTFFGSLVRSKTNGIIFNDEMDDFSIPGRDSENQLKITEPNFIQPGKRPLSSMTPTILVQEDGAVKMTLGASGGSRITTSVAQVILGVLSFGKELGESIRLPRLHHQLIPNQIFVEPEFREERRRGLRERNHTVEQSTTSAVVQAVYVVSQGVINATSDPRKGGIPSGLN